MHPMKLARLWALAGLLAVGLAVLADRPAAAQDPKSAPMATPDRTNAVTVTIGGQVRFQMKSKKRIKEAFNENERVVRVLADATDPATLILIGQAAGTSRLELTDIDGAKESYLIVVQRDVEMLRNLIRKTLPESKIEITPIGDSGTNIILSGYVTKEDDRESARLLAEALGLRVAVNSVGVGGGGNVPHVQLDVTLAKVDRTRARSRGANWIINGVDASVGSLLGGLTGLQPGAVAPAAIAGVGAIPTPATVSPGGLTNIVAGYAPAQIQLLLAALKTEGLAKLVAAPTIVAQSGERATLKVGGSVPVIGIQSGVGGPGVEYKEIGTDIVFTPIVYGNGKIHLTVEPRVRAVNRAGAALVTTFGTSPAFDDISMKTQVIVEPGQTIAIGGLIQTIQSASVAKIPHLGDIPFIGALFSYATQEEQETELVILLTPRLVDPADSNQMPKALPGSETRKPDDFEFYLETVLEAPRGPRQIWDGHRYIPAWKAGPSAAIYPCPGGSSVGATTTEGCPVGKSVTPAGASGKTAPPSALPPGKYEPSAARDMDPPSALITPEPGRTTVELPQK
ncbi:MAG: hypothetical protein EXS09_02945 [Gemmataceae bacterium]|nr:hypothetical protein [Gemmataceae bacterium]